MEKNGHNNPAFIDDQQQEKASHKGCLELTEKGLSKPEKLPKELDYNPYEHRNVEHPTTVAETLLHLLKGSLGTGILAMPNAFRNSGYMVGAIGTAVIGLVCAYCIHALIMGMNELCKRKKVPSMTYPEVAQNALLEGPPIFRACAPYITNVVNTFLLIYQLGSCCVYVVFVSSNIKAVADSYLDTPVDVRLCMVIILLPLILINWVRNLKYLAPFSTIANGVTLVSFAIITYYVFREPVTLEGKEPVGDWRNFPLFLGTVLFALEAIGVILPLENEMKNPKRFGGTCGVLNSAMIIIVILYVAMGLFGYLNYGSAVEGSITLNLPAHEIPAQMVKAMLAFAIYISHGLACYVAFDIVWNDYIGAKLGPERKTVFWEYSVRTLLVLITFLLAVAIPNLELFISLFGAFCLSSLGLAFPALIQISIYWYHTKSWAKFKLVAFNMIFVIIGVVGLFTGTYTSLRDIIATFN